MSALAPSVSISRPTFAPSVADPQRLSALALSGFLSLADFWRLTNCEAAALIAVSVSTLKRIRRGRRPALRQDQLTRIAALIAIFKGLRSRFADEAADDWVIKPNADPLFARMTPVEAMISGGIPRMLDIRRHVDAMRGGG
jgi:hypothetical protein